MNFSAIGLNRDCYEYMHGYRSRRLNEGLHLLDEAECPRAGSQRRKRPMWWDPYRPPGLPGSVARRVAMRARRRRLVRGMEDRTDQVIRCRVLGAGYAHRRRVRLIYVGQHALVLERYRGR